MGVHGLTTFLRENQRILSTTLSLPSSSPSNPISIVVDGWSSIRFIYDLYRNSGLPWVYGGEYPQFVDLVGVVVNAWFKVGLKVHFVFDGPLPELKFPTQVSRLGQSHVQPSLLFFRTSPTSRGTGRFLNETRIIPPLAYTACITALKNLKNSTDALELHFADEEGDPYAVELAGKVGGYVVGNDSDFVILNTEGYRGYIPLEEMTWYASVTPEAPSHEEDSDFQEVRKPKSKKRLIADTGVGRGVIPPDGESPTLTLTVYKPELLATHLKIPVTLLPLLGALVGNDYTVLSESNRRNFQSLFFEKQLSLSQRITRVASTIQSILSPSAQKRKKPKHQVGSVMDLIDRAVNTLLARVITTMGSGEVDIIVEKIVEATLQYAIPKHEDDTIATSDSRPPNQVCSLHPHSSCPLLPLLSRRIEIVESSDSEEVGYALERAETIRSQYLEAFRGGDLSPKLLDTLSSGTFWPRLFLENPDFETVSRSIGRPIREWIYSILDDALGLPSVLYEENEGVAEIEELPEEAEDLDELVDVVESDSEAESTDDDLLAPLKGELHRIHSSNELPSPTAVSKLPQHHRPPVITEYLRRGTRVAEETVSVKPTQNLFALASFEAPSSSISAASFSLEEKFTLLLRALESDVPPIRLLPKEHILPVLAVRWVVRTIHLRAEETKSKEREKERWTKNEAICFLAAFNCPANATPTLDEVPIPILDRSIQLCSQALQALENVELLTQTLLLTTILPSSSHLFSGRAFHKLLAKDRPSIIREAVTSEQVVACEHLLEEIFAEDRHTRTKKTKKGSRSTPTAPKATPIGRGGGLFDALSSVAA
ncbi:hypothetical protein H0H92_000762 [Tricholoma furcatifolium]|nr:hypothetical protein H0H92_000762 [Tricholoma furcatifolium]